MALTFRPIDCADMPATGLTLASYYQGPDNDCVDLPADTLTLLLAPYCHELTSSVPISLQPKNNSNTTLTAACTDKNLGRYAYDPEPKSTAGTVLPRTIN